MCPKRLPGSRRPASFFILSLASRLASPGSPAWSMPLWPAARVSGWPAIGGSFTMIGQDGRVVTNANLAGRPYLVFFGYTHCPDFCPTALFDISAVFKELGPDKRVAALLVTIDTERDTPDILKSYLENFDSRIIGLTGDPSKTEALAKAFRVYAKKLPGEKSGDYRVDHTGIVYLMDRRGKFA